MSMSPRAPVQLRLERAIAQCDQLSPAPHRGLATGSAWIATASGLGLRPKRDLHETVKNQRCSAFARAAPGARVQRAVQPAAAQLWWTPGHRETPIRTRETWSALVRARAGPIREVVTRWQFRTGPEFIPASIRTDGRVQASPRRERAEHGSGSDCATCAWVRPAERASPCRPRRATPPRQPPDLAEIAATSAKNGVPSRETPRPHRHRGRV